MLFSRVTWFIQVRMASYDNTPFILDANVVIVRTYEDAKNISIWCTEFGGRGGEEVVLTLLQSFWSSFDSNGRWSWL